MKIPSPRSMSSAHRKALRRILVNILLFATAAGCLGPTVNAPLKVQHAWAKELKVPGVPNLHRVDDNLYRSGQPTALGFANLEKMGVRSVLNLRNGWTDAVPTVGTMLRCHRIPLHVWHIDDADIISALRLLRRHQDGPFLVHCLHGSDRTGVVCAAYRVVIQGWCRQDAIDEMRQGGFGHHSVFKNLAEYLRNMDVNAIRNAVFKEQVQ